MIWRNDYEHGSVNSVYELHFDRNRSTGLFSQCDLQTIKEMPELKKVQTNAVALITSLILTPASVIVLCTYYKIVIEWYYIFASFIAAFIVYLVSTGGWERVTEMWNRNAYKKK